MERSDSRTEAELDAPALISHRTDRRARRERSRHLLPGDHSGSHQRDPRPSNTRPTVTF